MGPADTLPITEDAPCRPRTPYGRSKREAEEGLGALVAEGLDGVVLRPCLVVGQGKKGGEMNTMLGLVARGLFPLFRGYENARKPLVAATDLADAIVAAASRGRKGAAYLVTCGIDHPLRRIVDTAAHLLGRERGHVELPYAPFRLTAGLFGMVGSSCSWPTAPTPSSARASSWATSHG
jgi:nucleoside-diphosphate-sugar epimerase